LNDHERPWLGNDDENPGTLLVDREARQTVPKDSGIYPPLDTSSIDQKSVIKNSPSDSKSHRQGDLVPQRR
jgi:hypothetical protein